MNDIESMPYDQVWLAFYGMETIHAEEMLDQITVSAYPDLKPNSQKDIDKRYRRQTRVHRESELRTMTPEELAYGIARKQLDGQ